MQHVELGECRALTDEEMSALVGGDGEGLLWYDIGYAVGTAARLVVVAYHNVIGTLGAFSDGAREGAAWGLH